MQHVENYYKDYSSYQNENENRISLQEQTKEQQKITPSSPEKILLPEKRKRNIISSSSEDSLDGIEYNKNTPKAKKQDSTTTSENEDEINDIIPIKSIKKRGKRAKKRNQTICVAPTTDGSYKSWKDPYFEEQCFPHLFPNGKGGYLSTYKNSMTFSQYVRRRMKFSLWNKFAQDTTYRFFLGQIKESLELLQSRVTYFRKAKQYEEYNCNFIANCKVDEIAQTPVGYHVFKKNRGFAPFLHAEKQNLWAIFRQLGTPHIFFTVSPCELNWNELIQGVYEKRKLIELQQKLTKKVFSNVDKNTDWEILRPEIEPRITKVTNKFEETLTTEKICEMTRADKAKILYADQLTNTLHFYDRYHEIFRYLKSPNSLADKYRVVDYFIRTEYQLRGAPHVHCMLWIEDENGHQPPSYDGTKDSNTEIINLIDQLISVSKKPKPKEIDSVKNVISEQELENNINEFQTHKCTFTCWKQKWAEFDVNSTEGHGKNDGKKTSEPLHIRKCRFLFPRPPMRETTILQPHDNTTDPKLLEGYKKKWIIIRNFMNRRIHKETDKTDRDEFYQMNFDEFL